MGRKDTKFRALFVSDSEYLVKGIREWAPGWERRGWTRKGGAIENLELWQALVSAARRHDAQWTWVRGHKGHAKNEYANDLAVKAAKEQVTSDGAVESGFGEWLAARRAKKMYLEYDADASLRHAGGTPRQGREVPPARGGLGHRHPAYETAGTPHALHSTFT